MAITSCTTASIPSLHYTNCSTFTCPSDVPVHQQPVIDTAGYEAAYSLFILLFIEVQIRISRRRNKYLKFNVKVVNLGSNTVIMLYGGVSLYPLGNLLTDWRLLRRRSTNLFAGPFILALMLVKSAKTVSRNGMTEEAVGYSSPSSNFPARTRFLSAFS